MPQFTAPFAALDADTREYLREVRRRQGDRTPGVYFAGTNWWPLWALLLGTGVLVLGVLFAIGSSKDAWAVALLLTAAGLLGGWLIVYAFRRWLANSSPNFAGYFTYFDPTHVYLGRGDEVTVCPVSDATAVQVQHHTSEGNYSGSTVHFRSGGTANRVNISGQTRAELVAFYYEAITWLRGHEDAKWKALPAAELGGVAKYVAAKDELPRDLKDIDLEVPTVPADPRVGGTGRGVGLNLLVILGIGAALYLALWASMGPTADALAFQAAKDSPTGLRAYLLDERNTRHRDEAQQRLAELYAPAETKVQAGTDENMKRGLLAVLADLKKAPSPVTSLEVKDADQLPSTAAVSKLIRTDLADSLAQHLGRELVAFVQPPDGQPPHVELEYRFVPADNRSVRMQWRMRFRPDPQAAAIEGSAYTLPTVYTVETLPNAPYAVKADVFDKLFKTAPPAIVPHDDGGGEW